MDKTILYLAAAAILAGIIIAGIQLEPTGFFGFRNTEEIKIVGLLPMTGNGATYGESMNKGAELAVEEINSLNITNGKRVNYTIEDSRGDPTTAVTALKSIDSNVSGVIIGISGVILSSAPIANDKKILLVNLGAKSPLITDAGDYVFSVIPNSNYDEKIFAKYVIENLGIKKAAILQINNDFGNGTTNAFSNYFSQNGGEVVSIEKYETDATDFKTQLLKIKQENPQGIFFVGYKELSNAFIQAKELGVEGTWLGPEAITPTDFILASKGACEGLIAHTTDYSTKSTRQETQKFVEAFKAKYGTEPDLYAANAYDAIMLIAKGAKEVGTKSEEIKDWMYTVKEYRGASGVISFDANGDVIEPIKIVQVKNGNIVPVENN
jgi:branched-chain amino acid transport system substrate-binding protein